MTKAAWLGLGVMGFPMAAHLSARGGCDVTVFNRTRAKAQAWVDAAAGTTTGAAKIRRTLADSPASAARGADYVFACVGNDDDLRAVTTGSQGAFSAMAPGSIFIDHTTASADVARELAGEALKLGITFLDCPVSGGQSGAEAGSLTIMCGGDQSAFDRALPIMANYAKSVRRIGGPGAGQLTKMVNQIAVAGVIQGLAEAIHFAEQSELDLEAVMATISKGAAQSWQMENRWKTMHDRQFNFGFAVDWILKDLGICMKEAARNGAQLPVTSQLEKFYAEIQASGGNRWDSSSLIMRLSAQSKPTATKTADRAT